MPPKDGLELLLHLTVMSFFILIPNDSEKLNSSLLIIRQQNTPSKKNKTKSIGFPMY